MAPSQSTLMERLLCPKNDDTKWLIFISIISIHYKSHLTWHKSEQGCVAEHFSHKYLLQGGWSLHHELHQPLMLGMRSTPPLPKHMAAQDQILSTKSKEEMVGQALNNVTREWIRILKKKEGKKKNMKGPSDWHLHIVQMRHLCSNEEGTLYIFFLVQVIHIMLCKELFVGFHFVLLYLCL